MKSVFLVLMFLGLTSIEASAQSRIEALSDLSPFAKINPTVDTAVFCADFVGSWYGECSILENGQSTKLNETFSISDHNACYAMMVGNEWVVPGGVRQEIVLSPSIPGLKIPPQNKSQNMRWDWNQDHTVLKLSAENILKDILPDGKTVHDLVTGKIYINNGTLVKNYSSSKKNVQCAYSKLSVPSQESPKYETSIKSFFTKSSIKHQPPTNNSCQDFSGKWKGTCVFESDAYTSSWPEEITTQQYECESLSLNDEWIQLGSISNKFSTSPSDTPPTTSYLPTSDTFIKQIYWNADKTELISHQDEIFTGDGHEPVNAKTEGSVYIRDDGKLIRKSFPHGSCYALCVYDKVTTP